VYRPVSARCLLYVQGPVILLFKCNVSHGLSHVYPYKFPLTMFQGQGSRAVHNVSHNLRRRWLPTAARITTGSSLESKHGSTPTRPRSEKRSLLPSYSSNGRSGASSKLRPPAQRDSRPGNDQGEHRRLLKPYDLSMQLKRMCNEGELNGAIERLKTTPRDAQNVAVWNTMISECLSAERYQLSYELFIDVSVLYSPCLPPIVTYLCHR